MMILVAVSGYLRIKTWAFIRCNKKITQRSIRYVDCLIWNKLPLEIKNDRRLSLKIFTKKV